jgi:protein O-mannosyl-transferase
LVPTRTHHPAGIVLIRPGSPPSYAVRCAIHRDVRECPISNRMARSRQVGFAAVLATAAFAVYWPAIHGQFIWDDAAYVTDSPLVHASDGLYRMWFTTEAIDYWPVTNSMYWLEWRLFGMNPTGYHVVNVLLHGANALLFWVLLRRLWIPAAAWAALLFVVHPVSAESVAWVAEGKNTLSLFFLLLSTLAFVASEPGAIVEADPAKHDRAHRRRFRNRPRQAEPPPSHGDSRWYVGSILCFAAAMLSKGSVATLPGILIVLAWWRRGQLCWRDVGRGVPFGLIAIGLTLVNIWFQTRHVTTVLRDLTLLQRLLGAGAVIWFYLVKALLPVRLVFVYPEWHIKANDARWWVPLVGAIVITAVLWWKRRESTGRSLLCAWLVFCLALVPVMGLSDAYYMRYSLVADRYAYIALLPVMASVAAGVAWLLMRDPPADATGSTRSRILGAGSTLVAIALAITTWHRSHLYSGPDTLWSVTLQQNPSCWLCQVNLAVPLVAHGTPEDLTKAMGYLNAAIQIRPDAPESHDGLGVAFQKAGRFEDAIGEHERAITLNRHFAQGRTNLVIAREHWGAALAEAGRFDEAASVLRAALADAPDHAVTHRELALILLQLGQTAEALAHVQEAIRLDPTSPENRDTLARLLQRANRHKEAIAEYREAVRLAPNEADWHNNLGAALLEDDQLAEAAHEFRESIRCDPRLPNAHRNLGVALAELNQLEEAAVQLREALRLDPSFSDAQLNLDEVTARMRRK